MAKENWATRKAREAREALAKATAPEPMWEPEPPQVSEDTPQTEDQTMADEKTRDALWLQFIASLSPLPANRQKTWKEMKNDAKALEQVRELKVSVEELIAATGKSLGISDLKLQQVQTLKKPDLKVGWFFNPVGGRDKTGQWFKVEYVGKKPAKALPAWLAALVKNKTAKNWQYDPKTGKKGSEITDHPEYLAKFPTKGTKLTDEEEAALGDLFE